MLDRELNVDDNASYSTTTDERGIIISVSKDFEEISGYTKEELMGKNHNIVRHPDMPKIIFKIMWEKLENNEKFVGYIKNHAKNGEYYWMANKTYLLAKEKSGKCKYFSYKGAMSTRAKHYMTTWYAELLEEERKGGIEASQKYMDEYLKFRGVSFNEYMETFLDGSGLLKVGFFMARKLFSSKS